MPRASGRNVRRARPLLGTFVDISVQAPSDAVASDGIDRAFEAIEKVHGLMSFHQADSDVSRLNRAASRRPVRVDGWTYAVLEAALDLHQRSDGAFDIAVAPALQRLGCLPDDHLELVDPRHDHRPVTADIELGAGCRVRFRRPGLRIDLGGIAKGFAVDRAIAVLRAGGASGGLVNAGGDIAAFGPSVAIDIRAPHNPLTILQRVRLTDGAIASSGPAFDPVAFDPLTFHPEAGAGMPTLPPCAIIDPASGAFVTGLSGASVRAPSCMTADALTKVVMLLRERSVDVLTHFHASALVVDAAGMIQTTDNWLGDQDSAAE